MKNVSKTTVTGMVERKISEGYSNSFTFDDKPIQTKQIKITERFVKQSLTSVGYDIHTAIYELIDNSKDAKSSKIEIIYDKENKILIIQDDGSGMSGFELMNSFDFGVEKEFYESDEIGYFGAGMKTAILNLLDKQLESESFVLIDTNNGIEVSKCIWSPYKSLFEVKLLPSEKKSKGTKIEIHGVKTFTIAPLRKNIGVIYFPILKSDTLKIVTVEINGKDEKEIQIVPYDPLYRHEKNINTNFVDATVSGESIRLTTCLMSDNFERHSWDTEKANGGWAIHKGGVYFIYGGRYIEYGGTFGAVDYADPWHSRTRIECVIPKNLTELFGVKFNKTKGVVSLENPSLDDLIRKIRDMFNWGKSQRKKESSKNLISAEESEQNEKLLKKLNKSASAAGFLKPETPETKTKVTFEAKKNKDSQVEKKVKLQTPKIRESKTFDLKFENFNETFSFWSINWNNGVFTITLNTSHPFYITIWSGLNEESKYHVMNFLGSLAYVQYETGIQDTFSKNPEFFWENFWNTFSMRLRHILNS